MRTQEEERDKERYQSVRRQEGLGPGAHGRSREGGEVDEAALLGRVPGAQHGDRPVSK